MEARVRRDHPSLCQDFLDPDRCPCILAELKECPICSHLQGNELCNCNWVGLCIYHNYQFADNYQLPPAPESGQGRILKSIVLNTGELILYTQVNSNTVQNFKPLDVIQLAYWKPPETFKKTAVILDVFADKNVLKIGLKTSDLCELYLGKSLTALKIKKEYAPVILGYTPLMGLDHSRVLIIVDSCGALLAQGLAKQLLARENTLVFYVADTVPEVLTEQLKALPGTFKRFSSKHFTSCQFDAGFAYLCCLTSPALNRKLTGALDKLGLTCVPIAILDDNRWPGSSV